MPQIANRQNKKGFELESLDTECLQLFDIIAIVAIYDTYQK
jgi:uncharacterized membrane protein